MQYCLTILIVPLSPATEYQTHARVLAQNRLVAIDKVPTKAIVGVSMFPSDTLGVITAGLAMITLLLNIFAAGRAGFWRHDAAIGEVTHRAEKERNLVAVVADVAGLLANFGKDHNSRLVAARGDPNSTGPPTTKSLSLDSSARTETTPPRTGCPAD